MLTQLPVELLNQISLHTDLSTIIRFSSTSRVIRRAAASTIREYIRRSWPTEWDSPFPFLEAIDAVAGRNASPWVRFALANNKAQSLTRSEHPSAFVHWVPELLATGHPIEATIWWAIPGLDNAVRFGDRPVPPVLAFYCIAAIVLASCASSEKSMHGMIHLSDTHDPPTMTVNLHAFHKETYLGFFKMLQYLKGHYAGSGFPTPTNVPLYPTIADLSISPLSDHYTLPVPLSHSESDQWRSWKWSSCSHWYQEHCKALASVNFLCGGTWQGLHATAPLSETWDDDIHLENIRFEKINSLNDPIRPTALGHDCFLEQTPAVYRARNCEGSAGAFELTVWVYSKPEEVEANIIVRPELYKKAPPGQPEVEPAEWICLLTLFGIHGFVGSRSAANNTFVTSGLIWLWKKD